MNNGKRELLRNSLTMISGAIELVSGVLYDERDCLDNIPENLSGSERYQMMETAIDNLENAIDYLRDAYEAIGETI